MKWVERLNLVFDYVEENLYEINYEAISKIAICPVGVLQRFFALNTGVTLTEYIRRRRLSEAALTLRHTSKKVIDVALDCGYESPDTFGVAFKRFHGITPSDARRDDTVFETYPRFLFDIKIIQKQGGTIMENLQEITQKITQETENVIHVLERAEIYLESGEYEKAVADLNRAGFTD